jgi:hypothetical protein
MPNKVNLDAMIPRQDFLSEEAADNGAAGDRGKQSASATDLRSGEMFFSTLRKPDFQRETSAWSPVMVTEFVRAFVDDELVPSVICWLSPSRLSFVIDGAHRLSAISDVGQTEVEKEAKEIYAALYKPPLQTLPRTEELPIAGYGYGTQTLPLIFDFVNISNKIAVVDSSKSKRKFTVLPQAKPDETATLGVLSNTEKLCRRISSTHASSLGFHPGVYFYSATMKHQPTTVLAIAQLVTDLQAADRLCGARADKKAMHLGHKQDKKVGGLGTLANSGWEHPFCNTTYKPYLQKQGKL